VRTEDRGVRRPAAPADAASSRHLAGVARGGLVNLGGAVAAGFLNFVLVVIVTRQLGAGGAGSFFVAIAMFSVLSNTLELGADTGLVRMIPRLVAHDRTADLRAMVTAALVPVFAASALAAVLLYAGASDAARLFAPSRPTEVAGLVRILAVFLPVSALYTVLVAGTRGFGSMVPSVLVDRIGKPLAQPALVLAATTLGAGVTGAVLGWSIPIATGTVAIGIWFVAMARRTERGGPPGPGGARTRGIAGEFWSFTAPRGFAGFFQVGILWADTLLIGALRTNREAGVYVAATRYVLVGTFAIVAILQVVGPKLSELLARRDHGGAQRVYQASTAWLVLLTWPVYITCLLFAPALLAIFGPGFAGGRAPLLILAGAMLVATAVGPVDVVLLMAGKSWWNLANTMVALGVNIALNLVLIPRYGIAGAGIAWAASVLVNNLVPLAQTWSRLHLHPFGRELPVAAVASAACFVTAGVAARLALGPTLEGLVAYAIVGGTAYLAILRALRDRLELGTIVAALSPTRAAGIERGAE
jgi:O-antigen/teichoic acid export membrane protein